MPTIAAAIAAIQAHPAPVVFLDTCALLDVVRAPNRAAASDVAAAAELSIAAKKSPPTAYLVISCPTPVEWHDNVDEAVLDCTAAVNCVDAVADAWSFLGVGGIPTLPIHALPLADRLKDLSKELRDSAILLDKDADALSRAIERVINSQLPARRGGKARKDAVILEHAIGLTDALRGGGFAQTCVFVSSNTRDFATPGATTLHPLLQPDFDPPTDLQYAVSVSQAVAILKADGWVP